MERLWQCADRQEPECVLPGPWELQFSMFKAFWVLMPGPAFIIGARVATGNPVATSW
jgi:hypothetical protein